MVIHKDQDRFRLVGTVKTELELVCSRCLEPFKLPVDREFDLRFLPAGAAEPETDATTKRSRSKTTTSR